MENNFDETSDPVQRERQLDYDRAIAQKIRNRLQQLENANEKDKRRWVWELLQNAKDTVNDRKVNIEIIVTHEYIEFKHNGGLFTPRNISNLVHQISSKENEKGNIGRFGTGFLTTHTLSHFVEVEGVFFENEEFYSFELSLDRQNYTEKELVKSIEKSWESYKRKKIQKPTHEVWTKFRYLKPNKELANNTLEDFEAFIHFNLAFVQGIGKITIDNQIKNYKKVYQLTGKPEKITKEISILSFQKGEEQIDLLLAENEKVSIAIEVEKEQGAFAFKKIAQNIPRVFCAFPLIGTEDFHFPFVINSTKFSPKTERDKLYLKGDTKDVENNKEILTHTIDLYKKVIAFASQNKWGNFFIIADTKIPKEDDDFDKKWYQENIQQKIHVFLLKIPIVELENGDLISILKEDNNPNTYFPYHSNTEICEKIWDFSYDLFPNNIPCKKDMGKWSEILWSSCYKQTIEQLAKNIQSFENAETLSKNIPQTYTWLNNISSFFEENQVSLFDEFEILPNQYGVFKFKNDLKKDKNIPNELKEIYKNLGTDWKEILLHTSIQIEMNSYYTVFAISEAINTVIKNANFDFSKENINKIVYELVGYRSKEKNKKQIKVWKLSKSFFHDKTPQELIILENTEKFDWDESLKWLMTKLVRNISELKYVEILEDNLHGDNKTITWLRDLIDFIQKEEDYKHLIESESYPILPNQNAWFYPKSQLFLDDGTLDEELKEVLRFLDNDWIDELLDKDIYLNLPSNRERSFEDIANQIDKTFRDYPTGDRESQDFKRAFEYLFAWFQEQDEEKLKHYFDWTSRNMTMLYVSSIGTNEERKAVLAIAASGKSHIFSDIANNENISNDDLDFFAKNSAKIKQYRDLEENGKNVISKQIALDEKLKEINAKLGKNFKSLDDFVNEFAKKDKQVDFMQEPVGESTFFDKKAINKSNENAKKEIYKHLKNSSIYTLTDWQELTSTIIQGVKKKDIDIFLIAKGANNGVIYLNNKEKEILKNGTNFSELWAYNGEAVFEINLGTIIERWNTRLIKANMFDFRQK